MPNITLPTPSAAVSASTLYPSRPSLDEFAANTIRWRGESVRDGVAGRITITARRVGDGIRAEVDERMDSGDWRVANVPLEKISPFWGEKEVVETVLVAAGFSLNP